MTSSRSVSSTVEVAADPATAFTVFTEELDCWWIQGPINFYDTTKAYGMRVEPGVGGRIVEVYEPEAGEGLEIARITAWEPGERLAWQSSVDDVEIDVRFTASGSGTVVRVEATIPAGGADKGGTAWVRMPPVWFGAWMERRDRVPHEPVPVSRLSVVVHYAKPATTARWLRDVFGLEQASVIPDVDPVSDSWIELRAGNCPIVLFPSTGTLPEGAAVTHVPWVFVDDLDAQYARVREGGATIVDEIWHHGVRAFTAADPEGYHWTFAQASPLQR
jgi:uncharacterized glyoxalase superfamily protein PhnB